MLIWGRTLLEPYLQETIFLAYWFVFLIFTCGAVGISLLDFFAVRRMLVEDIARLRDKALKETGAAPAPRATGGPEQRDPSVPQP